MDINQMKYFVEICAAGSMSRAAENLKMSQQGLSLAVRRLESELNCDLFYRKSSGLVLTEYGKMFKRESEEILRHVGNIYDFCSDLSSVMNITVSITTNLLVRLPTKIQNLLLSGMDEFRISLREAWTCDCENMVLRDEAAFGLVYGECDPTNFNITTLDVLKQVFIVSKKHPLALRDTVTMKELENMPLIVPNERCRPGEYIRSMFEERGLNLNIAYECDRPRQTIDVVSNNPNLAARIILDDVIAQELEHIKVLVLEDEPFLLPVCLINRKGRKLSMRERLFQHLTIDSYKG